MLATDLFVCFVWTIQYVSGLNFPPFIRQLFVDIAAKDPVFKDKCVSGGFMLNSYILIMFSWNNHASLGCLLQQVLKS